MALSGNFTGTTSNKYVQPKITWSATQDISGNYSDVTAILTYSRTNSGYTTSGTWSGSITINGSTTSGSKKISITQNSNTEAIRATVRVYHNTDGSKSLSISCTGIIGGGVLSNTNCSKEITLDTIPRAATLTAAPDFNDEQNATISYTNPASNAVDSLQACIANTAGNVIYVGYRDISKTGNSYTFNFTTEERKALRKAITSGNTLAVKFFVTTTIGNNIYYSTISKTLTLINHTPTLAPSVMDTGTTSLYLTQDGNKIIKGFNYISYSIGAAARKEATIVSQKITCGNISSSAASGNLNNVLSNVFTITATDSRGFTTTQTVTKTLIDYIKLTANLEAPAPSTSGETTIKVSGNYFNGSFGAMPNDLTVQMRFSTNGGAYTSWQTLTPTISGNSYTVSNKYTDLDYRSKYSFEVKVFDATWEVITREKTVKTTPVFDWSEDDFNFNVPVIIQGAPIADIVIEQATSGIWTYRKWNSGIIELWGSYGFNNGIACTNAWGSMFESAAQQLPSFPFELIGVPMAQYTWRTDSGFAAFIESASPTKSSAGSIILARPSAATVYGYISMYIVGKWR